MARVLKIGGLTLEWFGHASFAITGKIVVYIDPFIIPANPEKADVVFVTHEHYDHCAVDNIKKLAKAGTVVVAPPDCASKLSGIGSFVAVSPGWAGEVKGIKVSCVRAYNPDKPFHPKNKEWVGLVLTIEGTTFYHTGDTEYIPEMNNLKGVDVALFPIGGTYTMDVDQAVKAAKTIKPRIAVPMHYGSIPQTEVDPKDFAKKLAGSGIEVKILS